MGQGGTCPSREGRVPPRPFVNSLRLRVLVGSDLLLNSLGKHYYLGALTFKVDAVDPCKNSGIFFSR